MSGRGMIPADVPMLVELACRLREETHGCATWDRPGVAKVVTQMKTWNLEVVVEQILRRGTDPEARTPAALLHKMSSPLPSEKPKGAPRHPTPREACIHCGGFRGRCDCTRETLAAEHDDTPELPPIEGVNPRLAARIRERLEGGTQ